MQLRDVEYIVKIADTQNFTIAAEQLFVSQSALSQSIQRLENELGVKLFNRGPNKVTLTYAGNIFYEESLKILALCSRIQSKMSDICEMKTGMLNVALPRTYMKVYVSKAVRKFRTLYPGIQLVFHELNSARIEELCKKGLVDVGVICLPVSGNTLRTFPLFDEPVYLVLPSDHPFCATLPEQIDNEYPIVDLGQFKDENFVILKGGQRLRYQALDLCKAAGFTPNVVYETVDLETTQEIVSSGMGISIISETIRHYHPNDSVRYFRIATNNGEAYMRTMAAIYSNDTYSSRAAQEFIRILKETCASLEYASPYIDLYP